jgi:hypothetical protein
MTIMGPVSPRTVPGFLVFLAGAVVGCGVPGDDRPADWQYISAAIIAPNCATSSCHSPTTAAAGLDLSTAERGYTSLLTLRLPNKKGSDVVRARTMVVPYRPAESRMIRMLRADGANRMPPDRPLAEADIELIERWVLQGASE